MQLPRAVAVAVAVAVDIAVDIAIDIVVDIAVVNIAVAVADWQLLIPRCGCSNVRFRLQTDARFAMCDSRY